MDVKKDYPKVLLVSDATWSDDNNIGNTFSNLFGNWDSEKLALIYARADIPKNSVCKKYFQIAENRLIKSIINKEVNPGVVIAENINAINNLDIESDEASGQNMYSFFKKYRLNIFVTARNILWKIGNWKTSELDNFIDSFNPDVIFVLACEEPYMNELQRYIIKMANKKAIIYFVDDIYSPKHFSLSPFFWFNKMLSRTSIRKTVLECNQIYTIVDKQKKEYDDSFKRQSVIINKGGNFKNLEPTEPEILDPIKLIFTGNIFAGRWETLYEIGKALDSVNSESGRGELYVYTQNKLEGNAKKSFDECKSIKFMGSIPSEQVKEVQDNGDILVHVESFNLKEKLTTRLSFSTKLVDYFERRRCILAIGWSEAASIEYLSKNQAAVVVDDLKDLKQILKELLSDKEKILEFGQRGWNCGKNNHQIEDIRAKIYNDLKNLSKD